MVLSHGLPWISLGAENASSGEVQHLTGSGPLTANTGIGSFSYGAQQIIFQDLNLYRHNPLHSGHCNLTVDRAAGQCSGVSPLQLCHQVAILPLSSAAAALFLLDRLCRYFYSYTNEEGDAELMRWLPCHGEFPPTPFLLLSLFWMKAPLSFHYHDRSSSLSLISLKPSRAEAAAF